MRIIAYVNKVGVLLNYLDVNGESPDLVTNHCLFYSRLYTLDSGLNPAFSREFVDYLNMTISVTLVARATLVGPFVQPNVC